MGLTWVHGAFEGLLSYKAGHSEEGQLWGGSFVSSMDQGESLSETEQVVSLCLGTCRAMSLL